MSFYGRDSGSSSSYGPPRGLLLFNKRKIYSSSFHQGRPNGNERDRFPSNNNNLLNDLDSFIIPPLRPGPPVVKNFYSESPLITGRPSVRRFSMKRCWHFFISLRPLFRMSTNNFMFKMKCQFVVLRPNQFFRLTKSNLHVRLTMNEENKRIVLFFFSFSIDSKCCSTFGLRSSNTDSIPSVANSSQWSRSRWNRSNWFRKNFIGMSFVLKKKRLFRWFSSKILKITAQRLAQTFD